MGHLSSILCSHKQHIYHSTNKHSLSQDGPSDRSRQKMGHLSSILCSHKQHIYHNTNKHIYHSTNKHSLSQDGSSDRNRQKMGHLSSILCSHKQHIYHSTNKHSLCHLIGAAKRWQHTVLTQATHLSQHKQTQPNITRWVI